MTIKQHGGIFGRNPTLKDVSATNVSLPDNGELSLGDSGDLKILHDGSQSIIRDSGTGNLFIDGVNFRLRNADGSKVFLLANNGDKVDIMFDGSAKIRTEETGARILGDLSFNSGNGIDFSATSGTGTSELFDDYEEGTWTPTDQSGGSLSFSDADGVYTKIGDLVFATFAIDYPTTSDTNGIIIGGLPFTVDVKNLSGGTQYGGIVGFTSSLDFAKAALGLINASSTFGVYAQGTTGLVQNSSLSGKIVRGSVIYKT